MKKFVGIIVATVLAFSLVGCGPVDSAIQNIQYQQQEWCGNRR